MDYGLWYPKNRSLQLTTYSDGDWANCLDDRKSTSGNAFFLGDSLVAWLSKKQGSISLSTTESEYIYVSTYCAQVFRMKQTLEELEVKYDDLISILCDNTSAISILKNLVLHSKTKHIFQCSKTKHIPIKYHFLRYHVANKIIQVCYIYSNEQVIDIFTKPLAKEQFEYL